MNAVATLTHVLSLALLVAWVLPGCDSSSATDEWMVVQRDTLILGVDVEGTLQAVDSQTIGPPVVTDMWEFKIARMAPEGSEVEQDAEVVVFDGTELRQKLQEKQNEAAAAQKELEKKRQSLRMERRDQELKLAEARSRLGKAELEADMPQGLSARVDIRKAKLALELARDNVAHLEDKARYVARRDQADLEALQDKLDRAQARVREIMEYQARMTVKAPRPGTVIYTENWRGEKKKVGDSVWRAQSVLEIVSLDRMKADGMVAEMDASKVAVGQSVRLRMDALPDVEFAGQVTDIADIVQRKAPDIPVMVAHLTIVLESTDAQRMRPGMRFRGTVETGRVADALQVPIDAVFLSGDGPVVYRETDDGFQATRVQLGPRNKTHIQVLSGVREGDRISLVDLGRGGSS